MRFGLKNLYRAKLNRTDDGITFDKPVRMPGAVSATLTPEGSDPSDFYGDDGIYFTIPGTNGGYTGEFVLARLSDEDRRALLGEQVSNGIQFECTDDEIPEYAYLMEMQGDFKPIKFGFYCGKASRVAMNANTKGESVEVDTDTLSVRFTGVELPFNGDIKSVIKGFIEKSDDNKEQYDNFFKEVQLPNPDTEYKEVTDDEGAEDEGESETQTLDDDDYSSYTL